MPWRPMIAPTMSLCTSILRGKSVGRPPPPTMPGNPPGGPRGLPPPRPRLSIANSTFRLLPSNWYPFSSLTALKSKQIHFKFYLVVLHCTIKICITSSLGNNSQQIIQAWGNHVGICISPNARRAGFTLVKGESILLLKGLHFKPTKSPVKVPEYPRLLNQNSLQNGYCLTAVNLNFENGLKCYR